MDQQTFLTAVEFTGVASGGDSTPPVIAAGPTDLTATADSNSIELAWTNGDTYSSTVILRKTDGDYLALATGAGNAVSYDDTTTVAGITYTYKVRGVKATYPSLYSNEASDTVPTVPVAATGTITVVDYTQLAGAVLTIAGTPLTEGTGGGTGWDAEVSNTQTAENLAAILSLGYGLDVVHNTDNVIPLTAATPGSAGNDITLATSDAINLTISGPHLTGGSD